MVFMKAVQNIPWFAVYSFGGSRSGRGIRAENSSRIITKKSMEEQTEELVKKAKNNDINSKGYNPKVAKIADLITDNDLNDEQLNDLTKIILDKKNNLNKNKTKNI